MLAQTGRKESFGVMKIKKVSGALLCGAAFLMLAGCGEDDRAQDVEPVVRPVISMVVADVQNVRRSTYPGRAIAVQELNIGFEVPGRVLARPVDVGSVVQAGDVLATLDPEPYSARVRALEGQRAALLATLENAQIELARRETLLAQGHISQARLDDQIALVRATEANVEATEGALDEARVNLNYTTLVAPFNGTVSETYIDNFQNVNARQPVLRLLDTSRIKMEIAVSENLINLEPYVESIDVEFGSLPGVTIDARIAHVGNEASVATRTYPITIVMDQPDGARIQPGMAGRATANVLLPDDWTRKGIQVPVSAVFSPNEAAPDETYVWIVEPDTLRVQSKPVAVVSFTDRGLLVTGLGAGERIVTAGVNTLVAGQQVRLAEDKE